MRLMPKNEAYRSETGTITDPNELENAQTKLFYLVQLESFPIEKKLLIKNSPLSGSSKLSQFSPFIGPFEQRRTGFTSSNAEENNLTYHLVLTRSIPSYWTVAIQLHVYSSNNYIDLIVTKVWTT